MTKNNNGFYLEKLVLTGEDVEPAIVEFEKGLNVIYGPSDTGKTYIFQCIQFLLGKSSLSKTVPEAEKYTKAYLQIKTYTQITHTIERSLKGGDFKQYDCAYSIISTNIKPQIFNKDALSDFLLNICSISEKKALKNTKGAIKRITLRMLHNFFLLREDELQVEMSPIQKEQYTDKTYLENILKYLITGQDDDTVIIKTDAETISKQKNKLEFLSEIIISTQEELSEYIDDGTKIEEQINKLNLSIQSLKDEHIELKNLFTEYDSERKNIVDVIRSKKSRLNYLSELLSRAHILSQQYNSDISRLRSTIEAIYSLDTFGLSSCPVCNSEVDSKDINSSLIIESSKEEINKISALKNELDETIAMFESESEVLNNELKADSKDLDGILSTIEKDINDKINDTNNKMSLYSDKKALLSTAQILVQKISRYSLAQNTITQFLEKAKDNKPNTFQELDSILMKPITDNIKNILKDINFPDLGDVTFSDKAKDFIINNKNRQAFGKGFRAITYSVFIMALMELLKSRNYQLGLVVFDSPLVTYKQPNMLEDEIISTDLAKNFYNYLADNFNELQVIIIENTTPPLDNTSIHIIEFTKNRIHGRYGFIPISL